MEALDAGVRDQPAAALPKIKQVSHIATRTHDIEAVRIFYEDFLGLPMTVSLVADYDAVTEAKSNYLHCFFQLHDGSSIAFFMFEDGYRDQAFPRTSDAYERHLALRVDQKADVDAYQRRADEFGIKNFVIDHDDFYSVYVQDPDGEQIEISWHKPSLDNIIAAGDARAVFDKWLKDARR